MTDRIILKDWQHAPRCEYSVPGTAIVESPDCREDATHRHVRPGWEELEDQENPGTFIATYVERTVGMYCEQHSAPSLVEGRVVELVEYVRESTED